MKRIYEVMKAMDTDPTSFFKQVARGEIALIIESVTGEQIKPSPEFWKQVNRDNSYPTDKPYKSIGLNCHFSDSNLTITPNALKLLEGCDGFNQNTKLDFFKHITSIYHGYSPEHYSLHLSNIYTDYQPAQANNAPADSVENLQQQLNDARAIIAELEKKPTKQQQREQALLFWGAGKGYVKGETIPEMTREQVKHELQEVDRVLFSANFDDFWDNQNIFKLAKGRPRSNK